MPSAEIIAIGSELLLGETLDTNTQFLLRNFRTLGIDVYRALIIGDNEERISRVIRDALERSDIVVTTGGLGPTVDDPTRNAAAMALGCELEYRPELWQEIRAYFKKMDREPTLNNQRQAFIPSAARAISNPTGTAPAFYSFQNNKFLVSLPGVPKEMKYLFTNSVIPLLISCFGLSGKIVMRNLHSFGIGESAIDDLVGDLEKTANPSLGLCAKSGQIDLRITAKAEDEATAVRLVDGYEAILREKLGDAIFGADDDTLSSVVNRMIQEQGIRLRILEINSCGALCRHFPEEVIAEKRTVRLDDPAREIEAFLSVCEKDTVSAVLAIDPHEGEFVHSDVYVKRNDQCSHYSRSSNMLTVDENDWLQWTLNAVRLILLNRQMP